MKFMFITHFGAFGLNMFLTFKIVNFENVSPTKVIHFYMIKDMDATCIWYRIKM